MVSALYSGSVCNVPIIGMLHGLTNLISLATNEVDFLLSFAACGKLLKRVDDGCAFQILIMQPTMSAQRMVIGNILTGT